MVSYSIIQHPFAAWSHWFIPWLLLAQGFRPWLLGDAAKQSKIEPQRIYTCSSWKDYAYWFLRFLLDPIAISMAKRNWNTIHCSNNLDDPLRSWVVAYLLALRGTEGLACECGSVNNFTGLCTQCLARLWDNRLLSLALLDAHRKGSTGRSHVLEDSSLLLDILCFQL